MGKIWELKTPVTRNKTTISRKIRKGGQQAENLIVDLRYAKINERIAINTLQYNYRRSRRIKHILVISKTNQLLSLSKKKNKIQ